MITSKHYKAITIIMVCIGLLISGLIVYAADAFDTARIPEYQTKMFGDEIASIDIRVDAGDWQAMMDNAQAKEWIAADLIVNGTRFGTVGIRTKGNSSLSMGGGMRSGSSANSYSLQFSADKYIKGQSFFGLDTFCVNNMMGDATYMKDYLSYDIMSFIGVDTPLVNYASLTVNGEDYGFGIMLERYDQSYLDRVYGSVEGQLYNIKIGMGRRGDFEDMWQDAPNAGANRQQRIRLPEETQGEGGANLPEIQQGDANFRVIQVGGIGGFGANGGGSLIYTDDDLSSYASIFENAISSNITDKEKQRVVTALKNLNAGTDLEKYIDVDATLRYFAAHTVVVNLDSYTSNMQQNYYLYERGGKLTILPWDYNLSFGGYMSGNASSVVNFPVDTPVSGVSMADRPLLNMLLAVDEYSDRYHDYLRQIVEGYFESGLFESTVGAIDAKIAVYVKNDASAYYTYEQYEASLPALIELGRLRAESIKGQLDGTIPSTTGGQSADPSSMIDTSAVDLSALGSMMGGGGAIRGDRQNDQGNQPGGQGAAPAAPGGWDGGQRPGGQGGQPGGGQNIVPQDGNPGLPGGFGFFGGDMDMDLMMQAARIIMEAGGELTDEVEAALIELGLTQEQIEMLSGMQGMFFGGDLQGGRFLNQGGQAPADGNGDTITAAPQDGVTDVWQVAAQPVGSSSSGATPQSGSIAGYIILSVSLLAILTGAIVFIARPKKNAVR